MRKTEHREYFRRYTGKAIAKNVVLRGAIDAENVVLKMRCLQSRCVSIAVRYNYGWHVPRLHLPHARPPAHLSPGLHGSGEEDLLHLRMITAEQGGVMRRGRRKVTVIDAVGVPIRIPPAHFDPTRLA